MKNIHRAPALLLALLYLLSLLAPAALAAGEAGTVSLRTAEDLETLARNCSLDTWSQGKTVVLEQDIDLTGQAFTPIPTFGGTFLGQGHTISGVSLTGSGSTQGFFRYLQPGALVQDLNVAGALAPSGQRNTLGGLAGSNRGTLTGCSFSGTVQGGNQVGGVAGCNETEGQIINCSFSGSVTGEHAVGGIVGENRGSAVQCENSGCVNTTQTDPEVSRDSLNLDQLNAAENLPACLCAALPLPAMALGFLLRTLLTGGAQFGYANASSVYDTMANMRDWTGKLASLLTEYFGLFDIRFTDNASLIDPLQLPALLRVLIAGALLLTLPALAVFYRKCGARLARLFWATAAVCGVTLFLWFFGTISNAGWRLIPMVFSQLLLFSCAAVYACKSVSLRRFGALLCAGLALFGCVSFSSLLSMERTTAPAGKYQGLYDAVHGKGLRYGYGSFWVANALFVLSGGEVQTHNTGVSETGELVLEQYQQFPRDSAAYEQQDGSFLILLAADVGRFEKSETYRALAPYLTGTQTDAGLVWGSRIYFYSCDIAPYLAEG